jgi:hypothetical protein
LRLKPQLSVSEEFNDNILYVNKANARADLISTFSPGFGLDFGRQDNPLSAKLDYDFDEVIYARTTPLDHQNHHVAFTSRFERSRLAIRGSDSVDFLAGPINFSKTANDVNALNVLGQKVDRLVWVDNYHASYSLTEKTFVGVGIAHQRVDYESTTILYDYDSLRGLVDAGYQASEKLAFFGQGYYGVTSAGPNLVGGPAPDLDFVGSYLGIRGQFTPKLSGTVQAGYEMRSFAGSSSTQSSPVVELDLSYAMNPRRTFTLSYSRSSNVSVEAASYSYVSDVVGVVCSQALGTREKLNLRLGAYTRFTEYDQATLGVARSDKFYSFSADLSYKFERWLTGSVGYDYERLNTSSPGVVDYGVNRVTLKLTLGY